MTRCPGHGINPERPAYTKHTIKMVCNVCGRVWAQPDWYKSRQCFHYEEEKDESSNDGLER